LISSSSICWRGGERGGGEGGGEREEKLGSNDDVLREMKGKGDRGRFVDLNSRGKKERRDLDQ